MTEVSPAKMLDDDNSESIGSFPAPSPGRCIYGFVLFLFALVWLVLYHAWAFTPTSIIIEKTGITYIPSKYWAISLPVFFVFLVTIFAMLLYPGVNLFLTPSLSDPSTIIDRQSRRSVWIRSDVGAGACIIPPTSDLPLDFVCNQLYL